MPNRRICHKSEADRSGEAALCYTGKNACATGSQLFVAFARRTALEFVHQLAVRTDALIGMLAPQRGIVAGIVFRVAIGLDVQSLPAQVGAAIDADFHGGYPLALAASSSARLTATLARVTL